VLGFFTVGVSLRTGAWTGVAAAGAGRLTAGIAAGCGGLGICTFGCGATVGRGIATRRAGAGALGFFTVGVSLRTGAWTGLGTAGAGRLTAGIAAGCGGLGICTFGCGATVARGGATCRAGAGALGLITRASGCRTAVRSSVLRSFLVALFETTVVLPGCGAGVGLGLAAGAGTALLAGMSVLWVSAVPLVSFRAAGAAEEREGVLLAGASRLAAVFAGALAASLLTGRLATIVPLLSASSVCGVLSAASRRSLPTLTRCAWSMTTFRALPMWTSRARPT